MKEYIENTKGSAPLWAAFIAFILCMLSIVAYTAATLYSTYQTAQTELERAASITVDENMENRNVRDLELNIPQEPALADLESNLAQSGWDKGADGTWKRFHNEKVICELRNLNIEVHEGVLGIFGLFAMPLPWSVGSQTEVVIPIAVRSKVIYLD